MDIDITPVNDVPVATAGTVSASEDNPYTFAASDFTFTDVESDSLVSVTITNRGPETARLETLLQRFLDRKLHMAIVVDEFGSAIGLISAEDILEQVVGEIEDVDFRLQSHHQHTLEELENGVYLVNAHLSIADLNEQLNLQIPAREFHTVGGLLVSRLQRIPVPEDYIIESGFRFSAVQCDERMVKKVKVEPANR